MILPLSCVPRQRYWQMRGASKNDKKCAPEYVSFSIKAIDISHLVDHQQCKLMSPIQLWLIYKGVCKLLNSCCCFLDTWQLNQTAGCAAERNQFSHQLVSAFRSFKVSPLHCTVVDRACCFQVFMISVWTCNPREFVILLWNILNFPERCKNVLVWSHFFAWSPLVVQ